MAYTFQFNESVFLEICRFCLDKSDKNKMSNRRLKWTRPNDSDNRGVIKEYLGFSFDEVDKCILCVSSF